MISVSFISFISFSSNILTPYHSYHITSHGSNIIHHNQRPSLLPSVTLNAQIKIKMVMVMIMLMVHAVDPIYFPFISGAAVNVFVSPCHLMPSSLSLSVPRRPTAIVPSIDLAIAVYFQPCFPSFVSLPFFCFLPFRLFLCSILVHSPVSPPFIHSAFARPPNSMPFSILISAASRWTDGQTDRLTTIALQMSATLFPHPLSTVSDRGFLSFLANSIQFNSMQ